MTLIQRLPDVPLDIIGDIHGELEALRALLRHLGYKDDGRHPEGRKIVFVGDLCDRGPYSYSVIKLAQRLIAGGHAQAILGNHELNLLTDDIKDGSGWFFDERLSQDQKYYAPFERAPIQERENIRSFLEKLPVILERDDIRVVHAAWTEAAANAVASASPGAVSEHYRRWDELARHAAGKTGLYAKYLEEKVNWADELEDEHNPPPFLHAIAEYEATQQTINPLKVLTSGVETKASTAFFAGNRWRFSDRTTWWDDYEEKKPVVIGHYWRLYNPVQGQLVSRYSRLFSNIESGSWHGKHRNVFCVDFSVGARWRDRRAGRQADQSRFRLGALQWPERRLVFDTGLRIPTY